MATGDVERTPQRAATAAASLAILIYAAHNVVATPASLAAGRWYDRAGPRAVFTTGAAVYVIAYAVFAAGSHSALVVTLGFALAGAGIGLAEPTQSAVVSRLLPDQLRGTGFGVLGTVHAAGDVVATVVPGLLYTLVSHAVAFGYAAAWMAVAVVAAAMLRPSRR